MAEPPHPDQRWRQCLRDYNDSFEFLLTATDFDQLDLLEDNLWRYWTSRDGIVKLSQNKVPVVNRHLVGQIQTIVNHPEADSRFYPQAIQRLEHYLEKCPGNHRSQAILSRLKRHLKGQRT